MNSITKILISIGVVVLGLVYISSPSGNTNGSFLTSVKKIFTGKENSVIIRRRPPPKKKWNGFNGNNGNGFSFDD